MSINRMSPRTGRYLAEDNRVRNIIEPITGVPKVIQTDHAYIHEGIGFKSHLTIGALAAAASVSFSLQTPAHYLHFKNLKLAGIGASVKAEIMRGTTASPLVIDSPGVAPTELIGPSNMNDSSTKATGVVIKKTPTYVGGASGTVWDIVSVSGSSTNQFISTAETQSNANEELVMKPNTYYVVKITNLSPGGGNAASGVHLTMFWYEEAEG